MPVNRGLPTINSSDWILFITRPIDILSASIFYEMYHEVPFYINLGLHSMDTILVQESKGKVHYLRRKDQQKILEDYFYYNLINGSRSIENIIERGMQICRETQRILDSKEMPFGSFNRVVDFTKDLMNYTTSHPVLILTEIETKGLANEKIETLAKEIRATTLYPSFISNVLIPLAKKEVSRRVHIDLKDEQISNLTIRDIISADPEHIFSMIKISGSGKRFIFLGIGEEQSVTFQNDNSDFINKFRADSNPDYEKITRIKGIPTYHGKVKGCARILLTSRIEEALNAEFNEGDILVSINGSPSLSILMAKCGGMITDEGGISSHAAILSRELKKPCITATKLATAVIKDGDIVEIDTYRSVVNIIR